MNIVYVGTLNVAHYDDAMLALEAGKHCLLEKVRLRLSQIHTVQTGLTAVSYVACNAQRCRVEKPRSYGQGKECFLDGR